MLRRAAFRLLATRPTESCATAAAPLTQACASTPQAPCSCSTGSPCQAHCLHTSAASLGRRDASTRKGKIFRGSFGKSRPRKAEKHPYILDSSSKGRIPIPYPPHQTAPKLANA
ncbi:hypothetical protein ACKKBG_A00275 [Auxenochlorella protothecoides x Auxenochlorella symbiontica]